MQAKSHSPAMRRMTLVELLIASGIFLLVIAGTISLSLYILTRQKEVLAADELRGELGVIIQALRGDSSLSSLDEMVFYPSPSSTFLSISMPIIRRPDGESQTAPVDAADRPAWTHTVIYHVFTTEAGVKHLRRTVIGERDNTLEKEDRYDELEAVVEQGDGSTLNSPSTTMVLCRNLDDFWLILGRSTFDTYAATEVSQHLYLGTQVISPGAHTLTLTTAGAHEQSSGQRIGIDSLTTSTIESRLEAEYLAATATGAALTTVNHWPFPSWSNFVELRLDASEPDSTVSLPFYNDSWMEGTFDRDGAKRELMVIRGDVATGEQILQLVGMNDVAMPRYANEGTTPTPGDFAGTAIRIVIPGGMLAGEQMDEAPKVRLKFQSPAVSNSWLRIVAASIMERGNEANGSGTAVALTFVTAGVDAEHDDPSRLVPDAPFETDWFDLAGQPFRDDTEYLVTLVLQYKPSGAIPEHVNQFNYNRLAYWETAPADSGFPCYVLDSNTVSEWGKQAVGVEVEDATPAQKVAMAKAVAERADWTKQVEEIDANGNTVTKTVDAATTDKVLRLLTDVQVSHPPQGTYTSRVLDTKMSSPNFNGFMARISNAYVDPDNSDDTQDYRTVEISFRSSDSPETIQDVDWSTPVAVASDTILSPTGLASDRYVQFQAILKIFRPGSTSVDYTSTPSLHYVMLTWPGTSRAVDVSGRFGFGPDRGQFTADIDGFPLTNNNLTFHVRVKTLFRGPTQFTRDLSLVVSPRWH